MLRMLGPLENAVNFRLLVIRSTSRMPSDLQKKATQLLYIFASLGDSLKKQAVLQRVVSRWNI